jgi:hypothetical protein
MNSLRLYAAVFLLLTGLTSPAKATDSGSWFDGKWFPISRSYGGDGTLSIKGSVLIWGYRPTTYAIVLAQIGGIPASDGVTVLRTTIKKRARDGRAWGLGEKESYLVIRPYKKEYLSVHVCSDLEQVRRDVANDGSSACSTGAFSRNRKDAV